MNIISLGSNCEMSLMINNQSKNYIENSILYTYLFTWSSIKIDSINYIFKNPEIINSTNFKTVYRIFNKYGNISKNHYGYYDINELYQDLQNISNIDNFHFDIDFRYEDVFFWSHGIQVNFNDFSKDKCEEYNNTIHSKNNHLIEKFNNILQNQEPKLFCIKCLAGEYSIENIIDLNRTLLQYCPQNYLAIIVEEDKNINLDNLNLINTCIIVAPKLTGHNEAILSEKYNTEIYYKQLFEKIKNL
jgi:hypothetical protein